MLQDIATLTAGTVISEEIGMELEKSDPGRPGSGESVWLSTKIPPPSLTAWAKKRQFRVV
jgi:chaperonin GroEL (HSP60 family)